MRYSSFNQWQTRGKRGWIFGPVLNRTVSVIWQRSGLGDWIFDRTVSIVCQRWDVANSPGAIRPGEGIAKNGPRPEGS